MQETVMEVVCVHRWDWEKRWGGASPDDPVQEWDSRCKRCDTRIVGEKKDEYDPLPRVVVGRVQEVVRECAGSD